MMPLRVLGVMTGNSCDGLDTVLMEFSEVNNRTQWKFLERRSRHYSAGLRKRVLEFRAKQQTCSFATGLELDRDIGIWMGNAIKHMWFTSQKMRIDLIANHGQTVAHFPNAKPCGFTSQLGDPSQIATRTDCNVISHFRNGDIAIGGQGAPLAPLFHLELARLSPGILSEVAIHNIGGIANVTAFKRARSKSKLERSIVAFDTGPGNLWLDEAVRIYTKGKYQFDRNGEIAKSGSADQRAVEQVLKHPFFGARPPKSTGRDQFPFSFLKRQTKCKGPDLVATAFEVLLRSIEKTYFDDLPSLGIHPKKVYFCGGGALNNYLLETLKLRLKPVSVETTRKLNTHPLAVEAAAFALLGYRSLLGKPLGGPWTHRIESSGFASPGWLTPGKNYGALVRYLASISK